jgi:hypothetical protein
MSNALSWAKEMNTINHFFKSALILISGFNFFALAKQLNSIIIVQYYMSEASFRIADSVKISRRSIFSNNFILPNVCHRKCTGN